MSCPILSVIIPTYNRKNFLAEAINSVLKQSLRELEVIVIDDCSSDATEDYVKNILDERVRYLRNEKNSGQHYSRRLGFRHSQGKYITFLDHDDYYTDMDFFTKAINIHENERTPLAFVCANAQIHNEVTGKRTILDIGKSGRTEGIRFIMSGTKPPSVFPTVFSAYALRQAGFDDKIIFDTLTYHQAALHGDVYVMPDIIGIYRIYGGNTTKGSKNNPEYDKRFFSEVKESTKQEVSLRNALYNKLDRKIIDNWYIIKLKWLMHHWGSARPSLRDNIKVYRIMVKESGFNLKLYFILMAFIVRLQVRRFSFLRRLYRKFRYGDSEYGEI